MNPKDIMTDAIHNFHPQYQQYTQYSSGKHLNFILHDFWIVIFDSLFAYYSFTVY